jgi:hypothetical protein
VGHGTRGRARLDRFGRAAGGGRNRGGASIGGLSREAGGGPGGRRLARMWRERLRRLIQDELEQAGVLGR